MANRLSGEQSPYLQQHMHNPVHWWPWGDDAFSAARESGKPLLVSIGYSACHWCHVMERESFEDETVAAYMNEHFINVKVDREEYPDVDDFYMTAVQAMTGSGGWPLNVFVTPDRVPFYGGTYFPPQPLYGRVSWMQLLERMQGIWQGQQDEVRQQSAQMMAYLRNAALTAAPAPGAVLTDALPAAAKAGLMRYADKENGGFGRAPKFPSTLAIGFLLEYARFQQDEAAKAHALHSLDAMIAGGIYDQAGGGFARYSVDDHWLAPHFEKMLYDNALLIAVLSDAYLLSGKPAYREVIQQTIAFINREMTGPEGGFYSALDADSEGEEGKFYTWTWAEWQQASAGFHPVMTEYFGVLETGNWEGTNILHRAIPEAEAAARAGKPETVFQEELQALKAHLLQLRAQRPRPGTDDKCLLSWNALMNTALSKAGIALGCADYLGQATAHMHWMLQAFSGPDGWKHTWKQGQARIAANLDDLAFLVRAQLALASATAEASWLAEAEKVTATAIQYFAADNVSLLYFTSSLENNIPLRKPETYDGVTPSSNAVMANNLYLLGMLREKSDWISRAEQMLLQQLPAMQQHPASFALWNTVAQRMLRGFRTVTIDGDDAAQVAENLQKKFLPQCFIFFGKKENFVTMPSGKGLKKKTQIFICDKNSCGAPLEELPASVEFAIL